MRRYLAAYVKPAALLSTALAAGILMPHPAEAISATTTQLQLFADKQQAAVNGSLTNLDEPPVIINNQFYVPAKWFADRLDFPLQWDSASNKISLITPRAFIEFDTPGGVIAVNGSAISFDSVAVIRNGRLLVQLSWLAQYAELPYRYKAESRSVVVTYVGQPAGPYKESELRKDDSQMNSRPAAIFAFGKASYRIGEPVDYIDLSYDPDAEGLPEYKWTGKQEAYFKPGEYTVTLQVGDRHGNRSDPFSQTITIEDEVFISEADYPLYTKPLGSVLQAKAAWLQSFQPAAKAKVPVLIRQPDDRKLIYGASAQPVTEPGFLYQDSFSGSSRLSLQYVNGMTGKPVQFAVMLRNNSLTEPVRVTTTRKADSPASVYTPLISQKTVEQFLTARFEREELSIEPGEARFYKMSPELAAGQGFQGIYDLETNGSVTVSYVMIEPGAKLNQLGSYGISGQQHTLNGSYPVADAGWHIDARELKVPAAVGIGDRQVEPPIKGRDTLNKTDLADPALAALDYRVQVETRGQTVIALHPRSGFFQGAVLVNGNPVVLPAEGITSNELVILHRTNGAENSVLIELMAAGGSRVPVDLALIPMFNDSADAK